MKATVSEYGYTHIEAVITIMIIAIAMTGLIAVWSNAASRRADPYLQAKTTSMGAIYLAQIQRQTFTEIQSRQQSAPQLASTAIRGYADFTIEIKVTLAGSDFALAEPALKKISIQITPPQGYPQQFVTYKGRL